MVFLPIVAFLAWACLVCLVIGIDQDALYWERLHTFLFRSALSD